MKTNKQAEGLRTVNHPVGHRNRDAIISVGYRAQSQPRTQFCGSLPMTHRLPEIEQFK